MDMESLKVLEWNINQRAYVREIPEYVTDEIINKNPDIVVLVEFKGEENAQIIERKLSEYVVYYYNGVKDSQNSKRLGNGILIALKKDKFLALNEGDIYYPKEGDNKYNQPNWLKIQAQLKNHQTINIIGVRVIVSGGTKQDLIDRKAQIKWLLDKNKDADHQIILGDLNFGPHRTDYRDDIKLNWQDITEMIKDTGYLNQENALYSPEGTSWRDKKLDWLITKGVSVKKESNYNKLDWGFGRHNVNLFVSGYLVPGDLFIRTDPGNPDHAVLTAEIEI